MYRESSSPSEPIAKSRDGGNPMKLAIMQPYFLPYIGYFQLIRSVDTFVVYDNIKYTKKGWINRNRFLQNGADADFTIALKKDSDLLDIRERTLSPDFDKTKLLNKIREAYRKAPHFKESFELFETILMKDHSNLFRFIYASLEAVCRMLQINTTMVVSSAVNIDHSLKAQDRVIAICQKLGASTYINAIGGQELYSMDVFRSRNIELKFIKARSVVYPQFGNEFVPWLSILDVLMFNGAEATSRLLTEYDLI